MKQLKETPDAPMPVSRFRYWTTAPDEVTIPVAVLEGAIPAKARLADFESGQMVTLPAREIFSSIVPGIRLARLAELLPRHVAPGDETVILPAAPLATVYALVEHVEELPVEQPEPEPIADPEPVAESTAVDDIVAPPSGDATETAKPALEAEKPAAPGKEKPATPEAEKPVAGEAPAEVAELKSEVPPAPVMPPAPALPAKLNIQVPKPAAPVLPPKRPGFLRGLPVFRRNPSAAAASPEDAEPAPPAAEAPVAPAVPPEPLSQPPVEFSEEPVTADVQEPFVEPESVSAAPKASETDPLPVPEANPVADEEHEPLPKEAESAEGIVAARAGDIRTLETEHVSRNAPSAELADEDAMQALFLTEEKLSVARVIELCGGLPGINSCVLAHGSVVVASHNAPLHVDLVSLSAHAETMLNAMRESSARMGVGTVPAVTLHTEKGVISFFNREDLTMLVFHKDRGFVPGVREKMAAVLGELTKARIALPAGGESGDRSP